jgi:hypothetical protein
MMAAGTIVLLVTLSGWLMLNWRSLESFQLSFERKALFAVAWVVIIGGLAFVLTRAGL